MAAPRHSGQPGRLQRLRAALARWIARTPDAPPPSGEAWAPGDLAECIHDAEWFRAGLLPQPVGYGPQKGWTGVVRGVRKSGLMDGLVLNFDRWPDDWWTAVVFRKLTPRADAVERADAAFLANLKPRVVAASPLPASPLPSGDLP